MTHSDRERAVQAHLYRYAQDKADVEAFLLRAFSQNGRVRDVAVQTSFRSDPTAMGAVWLSDPPKQIQNKVAWIEAIDDTKRELETSGEAKASDMVYMMEKNFCMDGDAHPKDRNAEHRRAICKRLDISESTFYSWIDRITVIALYHAGKRGLI